jgi:HEAT repeat protein
VAIALDHLTGTPEGSTDWDAVEESLLDDLSSTDHQEVHLAIEALGHVGSDTGRKALRDYLESNPNGELRILMAAIRSLGWMEDHQAVPLLTTIMKENLTKKGKSGDHELGFGQKPIYLSATAAEALGRIGGIEAEKVILDAFPKLNSFEDYNFRMAEHKWLKGSNSSVLHFRMLEALNRMESRDAGPFVGKIIESLPSDKDRGLLYELDSYEKLTARVIERSGRLDEVVEACLDVLSSPTNVTDGLDSELHKAVTLSPHAEKHIRPHSAQARAAQVLSVAYQDASQSDRLRDLLEKYRADPPSETRSWCCFMLARTLGRLGDQASAKLFIDMLSNDPAEAQLGLHPPPAHIIYKGWRPFYRPAAAWALGELKAEKAVPVLMDVLQDFDNAPSTREQAAIALGKIGDKDSLVKLKAIGEDYPEVITRRAILESVN